MPRSGTRFDSAPAEKLLYRVEEAAELLSLSRTAVFGLINSGDLGAVKVGGRRRIPRRSIEDYVSHLLNDPGNTRRTDQASAGEYNQRAASPTG